MSSVRSGGPRRYLPSGSVLVLVATSALAQLMLLLSGPLSVRLLGVEGRGELAVLIACTIFMSQVGALGVPAAFAFMISSQRVAARRFLQRYWRPYLVQVVLVSALSALLYLGLTHAEGDGSGTRLDAALVLLGTAAILVTLLGFSCLQGEHRFAVLGVLQSAPAGWYAAVLGVLLLLGASTVTEVAALYLAGWLVAALAALAVAWRWTQRGYRRDAEPASGATIRGYATRAMVATAAPIDGLAVDQLLLGLLVTRSDLGLYVVGYAFATACAAPLVAVSTLVAPRLAALDRDAARATAGRWLLLALGAALAIALVLELVVGVLLPWAFGDGASPAVPAARILIAAGLALGLRRVGAAVLLGLGRPGAGTAAEVSGFAVLLVAFPVAATSGITAAAGALCAAALVSCVVQLAFFARSGQQ